MQKIILTDCDGCLCDWDSGFNKFMIGRGYPRKPGTEGEYSIAIRHGITITEANNYIREFNESELIEKLDPFADAIEYVGQLNQAGFKFIVVTSISSHPMAKVRRTKNLVNLFGDVFKDIHCIEMGASKAYILMKNWADTGYFWIEDHVRQAEAGHEAGLNTILIDHPYNIQYQTLPFTRVSYTQPWKEISNLVKEKYGI